jgi:mRNA interferase HigB
MRRGSGGARGAAGRTWRRKTRGIVPYRTVARHGRRWALFGIVTADRIVFNIRGNDYRLVVAVDFEKSIVWISWIGTHKDYDKIDVKEV